MRLRFIIIVFLNFTFYFLFGQEHAYRFYTVYDGLPQSQIQCVSQDCTGFIWVGTKGGLARFDGFNFESFTQKDGLVSNFIQQIKPTDSCIYFISLNGISIFRDEKFTAILANDEDFGLAGEMDGQLVFSTRSKGNIVLKGTNLECYHWYDKRLDTMQIAQFIFIEELHKLIISLPNSRGLYMFDGQTVKLLDKKGGTPYLTNNHTEFICRVQINDNYFKNVKYKLENETFEDLRLMEPNDPEAFNVIVRKDELIYFKRKDVKILESNKLHEIKKEFNLVNDVFKDKDGNYWVGDEDGLYFFWNLQFTDYTEKNSQVPKYVWEVKEFPKGQIWFASYGYGLVTLKNKKFTNKPVYCYPDKNPKLNFYFNTPAPNDTQMLLASLLEILKVDVKNEIEFAMNPRNTPLVTFYNSIRKRYIIGTASKGLFIRDACGKEIFYTGNDTTFTKNILDICYDKNGDICLGTKGLIKFKDGNFNRYPNIADSLTWRVFSLKKDHKGNIWIGTDQGLWFYNYDTVLQINTIFFKESVTFLKMVDTTWLMGGTTLGLPLLYLPDFYKNGTQRIKYYDRYNGFNGRDCGQNGTLFDSENTIWIPTIDRVIRMDPKKIAFNIHPPKLILRSIFLLGENLSWKPIDKNLSEFKNYQNGFRFSYLGINFQAPERVFYKYRLKGYSEQWSDSTPEREAIFTNLKPGHYSFEVKACNEDGYWTNEPLSYSIYIKPAWWQRIWVQITIGLLLTASFITITILIMKKRALRQREKLETRNRLLNMSLSTIKNQMDPHFTYNALNGIESLIMKEDRSTAYNYLLKLSGLIRETLNDNELLNRTLHAEIQFVETYLQLEKFRFKDKFAYEIKIDENVNHVLIIPKLIVQIFVENAIKHGLMHKEKDGLLTITIKRSGNNHLIIIKDNGIGRERAKQYAIHSTGKGLAIVRKLIRIFNEQNQANLSFQIIDLTNEGISSGTMIEITIPDFKRTN